MTIPDPIRPRINALREFLATEAGGGVLLLIGTIVALAWANSPFADTYEDLWHTHLRLGPEAWQLDLSLEHWVNDGLMAIFFFLIGLEIKRELVTGELRDPRAAILPTVAAFGGMAVPALLYLLIAGGGEASRGWGIPMATDIAFAIGVMALLGSRVSANLKLFLLTLAIVDDIGAIAVIALFYSDDVAPVWLLGSLGMLAVAVVMRKLGASKPIMYVPVAVAVWYATYRGGVHPTIAGVALGLLTPAADDDHDGNNVIEELEHRLHPVSSYAIVPLFAVANAGVDLGEGIGDAITSRVTLAVAVGLVVGKTVGISFASLTALGTKAARLPAQVAKVQLVGAGALGGIGFTVALFIASLAFRDPDLQAQAKIGILVGSLVSGILGTVILARRRPLPPAPVEEAEPLQIT